MNVSRGGEITCLTGKVRERSLFPVTTKTCLPICKRSVNKCVLAKKNHVAVKRDKAMWFFEVDGFCAANFIFKCFSFYFLSNRNLNFAAIGSEDDDYASFSKSGGSKGSSNINKAARDPQSHRIIEKRRRDRMNNCLADLSRLLPPACMKKGRGRIEKTEIIEMTIKHMKHLQIHACKDIGKKDFLFSFLKIR